MTYRQNVYRYASTNNELTNIKSGMMPETISIDTAQYPLPKVLPAVTKLPEKSLLQGTVKNPPKRIETEDLSYEVKSFTVEDGRGTLTLQIQNASDVISETGRFLLQDDRNRIFSFNNSPGGYNHGVQEVTLEVTELMPDDIQHLSLLVFYTDEAVTGTSKITDEASIPLF